MFAGSLGKLYMYTGLLAFFRTPGILIFPIYHSPFSASNERMVIQVRTWLDGNHITRMKLLATGWTVYYRKPVLHLLNPLIHGFLPFTQNIFRQPIPENS